MCHQHVGVVMEVRSCCKTDDKHVKDWVYSFSSKRWLSWQGECKAGQGRALQARFEVRHQYVRSSMTQRYKAEQAEINGQGKKQAGQ